MAYSPPSSGGEDGKNRGKKDSISPALVEPMLVASESETIQSAPTSPVPQIEVDGVSQSKGIPTPEDAVNLPWKARYVPSFMQGYHRLRPSYPDRRIWANHHDYNRQFKYTNNNVVTSKYNFFTFLPLNLVEQFMRVANIYFLILFLLQLLPEVVDAIPQVSSVGAATTAVPLIIVLGVTGVKDAFDDIKRHISDFQINRRKTLVLANEPENEQFVYRFVERQWQNVQVGDIVMLKKNDFVTADIVLLGSSEPNGLAYVETAELDGETNLKVRQSLEQTYNTLIREGEKGNEFISEELAKFDGFIVCDSPDNNLHKYEGVLAWEGLERGREPLSLDQLLLRGCRLRNTSWAIGMVVYAGHETKLMKNAGKTLYKRTQLDRAMNYMVMAILVFLVFLVICCLIGSLVWELLYGEKFQDYVPYDPALNSPVSIAFYQILSNVIILNTLVPISLYVSVELIRLCQSFLINWDIAMYYQAEDTPAVARTTTLNEELGQIDYVFSDKTGTLTQNVMVFHKCCIGKHCMRFGDTPDVLKTDSNRVDLSWNRYAEPEFEFYDRSLIGKCQSHDIEVARYFKLLALCHTVLANQDEDGKLTYNAQSPDEAALVSAARNFGYVFADRTPYTITLHMVNKKKPTEFETLEYKQLQLLDFNNVRKRMSVIVLCPDNDPHDPGKILLLCKGADSTVQVRLAKGKEEDMQWNKSYEVLQDYAKDGLRTLCMAYREITEEEYNSWDEKHHKASISVEARDDRLDEVYEEIETQMSLLGLSAIEDKLQDGVPEAIYNLTRANLKVWVLTGDKMETAINIGYACKLLQEDMDLHSISEEEHDLIVDRLEEICKAYHSIQNADREEPPSETASRATTDSRQSSMEMSTTSGGGGKKQRLAMVITGQSLKVVFDDKLQDRFLEAASSCTSVICSRVTPLQKRDVVDLVKKRKKAITLSIGDGANDVGMIKAAHIGVGISGKEGRQAVLASDFSFGQFRYLERLLLVHGRWSYHRMAIFLRYFFYKNFAFTFAQFLFAFFCGFTGQTVYNQGYIALYNVVYTSLPVVALAVLDQDVDEENCRKYPQLYTLGQKRVDFNPLIFILSLGKGILTAMLIFFCLLGVSYNGILPLGGYELDYDTFTFMSGGALTIIVNVQILMDTLLWTPITHLFIWISIISYFFLAIFFSIGPFYSDNFIYALFNNNMGTPSIALGTATFYFYVLLVLVVALFLVIFKRMLQMMLRPTLVDYVRLESLKNAKEKVVNIKQLWSAPKPAPPVVSSGKPVMKQEGKVVERTGYAYSHTEGVGEMLMSGRTFSPSHVTRAERRRSHIHSAYYSSEEAHFLRPNSSRLRHSSSRHSLRSAHSEHLEWSHEATTTTDGGRGSLSPEKEPGDLSRSAEQKISSPPLLVPPSPHAVSGHPSVIRQETV